MENPIIAGCGFHHVAIRVAEFDATVRFYTEALGFRKAVEWGEGDPGWRGLEELGGVLGLAVHPVAEVHHVGLVPWALAAREPEQITTPRACSVGKCWRQTCTGAATIRFCV